MTALCPGNASRSTPSASTSIGMDPIVWAASSRKSTPRSRASRPTSAAGWMPPPTFEACVIATSRVFGRNAAPDVGRIDDAVRARADPGHLDDPVLLEPRERAEHGVVVHPRS